MNYIKAVRMYVVFHFLQNKKKESPCRHYSGKEHTQSARHIQLLLDYRSRNLLHVLVGRLRGSTDPISRRTGQWLQLRLLNVRSQETDMDDYECYR